ncbi:hypothetical protein PG994_009764 [Apiospora phragmitis]|uniref:Uncharacterized protein n=1 Tax=Apiospora phragmitis TaxID=2905665 RepID=A0ABR1U7L1_9PEZI
MTSTILSSEFHAAGAPPAASRPQRRARGGSGSGGLGGQVKALTQQQVDKRTSPKPKKAGKARRSSVASQSSSLLEWDAISPWRQILEGLLAELDLPTQRNRYARDVLVATYFSIFSHVLGTLLFLSLPYHIFSTEIPPRYVVATAADIIVCSIYFGGVAVCFTLSTLFHTFMSHSPTVYARGMQLDFQGILLLMWGSTVPLAYYHFGFADDHPCQQRQQQQQSATATATTYGLATTALALLCSLATFHPNIGGPRLGPARAVLFAAFGAGSFLVPVGHGVLAHGWAEQSRRVGLPWIGLTVVCNGFGVVMYAFKIPEKWYPKAFDIFGASHQIMHIMVVFAALAYSQAVLAAFDYRHSGRMDVCGTEILQTS